MLLLTLIFLPFLGSVAAGLFGFYIGRKGSVFITTLTTFLSCIFSLIIIYNSITNEYEYIIYISNWINSGLFNCNWCFLFDSLTMIMLVVVTSISTLVHLYSSQYMAHDPHLSRFMSYLSLFTFFMIILVTGDNFMQMFVGWEGVGFCSYLLINFWFTRLQANKAAIKAMLVNRISDLILLLGVLTIFYNIRTIEYFSTFAAISIVKDFKFIFFNYILSIIDVACILIFIGAMGKSAQIFLHLWLPDAMEGPTPVSALIHAATMVTAGVYLTARCSPMFEYSMFSLKIITIIGASTAFFASTVGLVQNDFKKIVAYSTCSQLGYMFFACGLSNYPLAIFHLSNHAYFKALLFLCSGAVIHAMGDEQDIRKMGGLRRILPFTYIMFLIGSLSLMGFPFLTGFYSKDLILEVAFASFSETGHFAYWLGTIGAFFTAFYSTRLLFFAFLSETNAYKNIIKNAHDVPLEMGIPLGLLAFGSIFIGYISKDMFVGLGSDFWNNSIYINPFNNQMIDAEFLPTFFKLLPVILSFCGLFGAFYLYFFKFKFLYNLKISEYGLYFYNFLNRKWYFDKIYYEFINQYILKIGYNVTYKMIDKGLIEMCGPYGLTTIFSFLSQQIILLQTGYIYHYSLLMLISTIFLINIIFFSIIYYFNIITILLFLFIFLLIK
uniref:NADH-ubiquinone oxidoreductase chain 5 n=4 Tax=Peronosporaceae TaxID=4777 RepID=NU5M_PHYIN|nr:NADH dehydrogenase subunit 5 [Phytophthora infestans]P50366.1 RecName: Full=NADH-ubiquinone oxidoreductase chain 5; AltName: Full=NADH dehydrogenase subunit 5 [Phytophthora infestans]AHW51444.1 NADH dehydrogenase subunit 5 [Phytophthora andina]AAA99061.1 NADH dehydrogenase subunit 5 [Phytophthora infestans]AAW62559.1 NADH dehydrogenase subunit 5 [Phytophthora infestans]AAW67045.1 NADH dehydrogenase subunit 5 [Phytophthora infestans]AAW67091.1 NADH dehydrogenase subunit 5 [Phytophthora infe